MLTMSMMLFACSDFLSITPSGKKVVQTVEDHRDILASYLSFMKNTDRHQMKIMGVGAYAYPDFAVGSFGYYTGELQPAKVYSHLFNQEKGEYTDLAVKKLTWRDPNTQLWDRFYSFLGPINMIISDIDNASGQNVALRNQVKGEALVWRIFAYYKLLQYFSPIKSNEYGIPMYLNPSEDIGTAMPQRKTQKEVFAQLISDASLLEKLLEQTPSSDWNLAYREDFLHSMMASVYLWKASSGAAESSDWENAYNEAKKAIGSRRLESSLDGLKRVFDCSKQYIDVDPRSSEYFIRIADKSGFICSSSSYRLNQHSRTYTSGEVLEEYYSLYKDNDKRKQFYFEKDPATGVMLNDKYGSAGVEFYENLYGCVMPFRLAEAYLIAAEAACRLGKEDDAAKLLYEFKQSRYDSPAPVAQRGNALLEEILKERTREFYIEGDFLWMDMKRLGKTMQREVNGHAYTLEVDDFRYTLPIPSDELTRNKKGITQNPGWTDYDY